MNVLLIPARQIATDDFGRIDSRGFIGEVKSVTTDTLEVKCISDKGQSMTLSMQWVAAGVYRWQDGDYAVWAPLNTSTGGLT